MMDTEPEQFNIKDTPNDKNDDESRLFKQNKNKEWTPPYKKHIPRSSQKRYRAKQNSYQKKYKIQFK